MLGPEPTYEEKNIRVSPPGFSLRQKPEKYLANKFTLPYLGRSTESQVKSSQAWNCDEQSDLKMCTVVIYFGMGEGFVGRPPEKRAHLKIIFSYLSTKTYVVGVQKNRLNETVLLSTHNICLN